MKEYCYNCFYWGGREYKYPKKLTKAEQCFYNHYHFGARILIDLPNRWAYQYDTCLLWKNKSAIIP